MPKFFRSRKANEVKALIEALGYKWRNSNGDDAIYELPGFQYTVKVPIRNEVIPEGTMDYIKRMLCKNGATRRLILDWWKDNGFGE